jgi:hypothetical protein
MAWSGFLICPELLHHAGKLCFVRRNPCGELVALRLRLFLAPGYAFGAPGDFESLTQHISGQ